MWKCENPENCSGQVDFREKSVNDVNSVEEYQENPVDCANKKTAFAKASAARSDPDRIQTCDLLLRRQLLYSTELPDRFLEWRQK